VDRYLVLFARDPGREAREKGFGAPGEDLFATFAAGWREAARRVQARVVVAAPPEDLAAWRGRLGPDASEILWIGQRGRSFGERLEDVARCAASLPGHAVLVGGDVAPTRRALVEAFDALEQGADAVLAPARDGGVSLLAVPSRDSDLLATLAPRQRDVAETLRQRLAARGRCVALVAAAPDVDGRRGLRFLLRDCCFSAGLRSIVSRILETLAVAREESVAPPRPRILANPWGLRAPPVPA
jgi:glycosyltransferase A (GT-A) superfamily protein (DUF2064 family)